MYNTVSPNIVEFYVNHCLQKGAPFPRIRMCLVQHTELPRLYVPVFRTKSW